MRYVLGPALGSYDVVPTTPPPAGTLVDLPASLIAHDDVSVTLRFDPFDPAVSQPPAEVKLYAVPVGQPIFGTPEEFIASTYAVTTVPHAPAVSGQDVVVAKPDVPAGSYLGQVVFGYAV